MQFGHQPAVFPRLYNLYNSRRKTVRRETKRSPFVETSMTATSSGVSPTSRERPIVRYTTEQMLHALLRLNPETQLLPPDALRGGPLYHRKTCAIPRSILASKPQPPVLLSEDLNKLRSHTTPPTVRGA